MLNASCLDNREFTRIGQKQIRRLLSWLGSLSIDTITVANPYLGYLIRKEYSRFKLNVSIFASVDSVGKAKFWAEDIGVDKITLPPRIKRNFPLLKKFRSAINCELQLLANQLCLHDCPFSIYHMNFDSHASQSHHPLKGFGIDRRLINCRYKLFTQPEELIKASWIRPEDIRYYENVGINSLKVTDRVRETQYIISILKAYLERKFEGNLIDLLFCVNRLPLRSLIFKSLKFFFHPMYINIFKLKKFMQLFSDIRIYIDNRKLDGFLDYFFEGKCNPDDCEECTYCRDVAERVIHIDNGYKEKVKKVFKEIIESLTKGDMFKYF